jgi:hypothetical protein
MAEENQVRVYGMADQANRHPPAAQGMRGENSSAPPESSDSEFRHAVTLESGRTVAVSEGNGVAYAEASGKVERPAREELEVEFVPEASQTPDIAKPLLIGALLAGAGAALYVADRWLRQRTDGVATDHATGPLVPVQDLPQQQQPALVDAELSSSASRT